MNLNSKPHHTQRRIVVAGTGSAINLFALAMFATPATTAQKPAAIRPHATLSTNRERAYDRAIAGGCKATTPTLTGRRRDTVNLSANATTTGQHTFDDADEYARTVTQAIDGGITEFANDFGLAIGVDDPSWHPVLGGS